MVAVRTWRLEIGVSLDRAPPHAICSRGIPTSLCHGTDAVSQDDGQDTRSPPASLLFTIVIPRLLTYPNVL